MKVLLIKDVYKLGRAGDVKRVATGYGRNYLLPQGLAVLATPGAMKQAERIRSQAEVRRSALNDELKDLAEQIGGLSLTFTARASETGKMYGSITTQDVAEAIQEKTRYEVKRQEIDMQPVRMLGEHIARVRLTMDLIPEVKIIVHREGEVVASTPEGETKPQIEPPAEQLESPPEEAESAVEAPDESEPVVPEAETPEPPEPPEA
jgi:large subunit ribosomal protein L9